MFVSSYRKWELYSGYIVMLQTIQMKLWWFIIYLHILVYIWQVHVFVWCAGVHVVAMVPVLRSGNNSLSQFSPSIYIWIPAIKFKCQPCTTSALPTGWSYQPQIMLWKLDFMSVKKHIICMWWRIASYKIQMALISQVSLPKGPMG